VSQDVGSGGRWDVRPRPEEIETTRFEGRGT
jgi:hypothetical protein